LKEGIKIKIEITNIPKSKFTSVIGSIVKALCKDKHQFNQDYIRIEDGITGEFQGYEIEMKASK
jgi:hypothetical protein